MLGVSLSKLVGAGIGPHRIIRCCANIVAVIGAQMKPETHKGTGRSTRKPEGVVTRSRQLP